MHVFSNQGVCLVHPSKKGMGITMILLIIVLVLVGGYLLYALVNPEKF